MSKKQNTHKMSKKQSPLMLIVKIIMLALTAVYSAFMTSIAGAGLIYNRSSYGPELTRIGVCFIVSAVLLTAGAVLCIFRKTIPNAVSLALSGVGIAVCMRMLCNIVRHADSAGWSDKFTMLPVSSMYLQRLFPAIAPAALAMIVATIQLFSYDAAEERREWKRRRKAKQDAPAPSVLD